VKVYFLKSDKISLIAEAPEATNPKKLAPIAMKILFWKKKDCSGKREIASNKKRLLKYEQPLFVCIVV